MPAGRPTDYTPEIADEICAKLAEGESVRSLCKDEGMPAPSTVFLWLRTHKEFSEQYARAKEMAADAMADEILDIADNGSNDWMEKETQSGDTRTEYNGDAVQRSKLRVDTRKWLMSKLMPKKYGDKLTQEVTGAEGGPIQTESRIDVSKLTTEQLKALRDAITTDNAG